MKKSIGYVRILAASLIVLAMSAAGASAAAKVYADDVVVGMVFSPATEAAVASAVTTAVTSTVESNAAAKEAGSEETKDGKGMTIRVDRSGVHLDGSGAKDDESSERPARHEEAVDIVGLVAVVVGCMVPVAIVGIVFYARHRRIRMHHETIRAMIEKGMPVPPEMIGSSRGESVPTNGNGRPVRNDLRSGLIVLAVGAGLLMFIGKVGWILVFIGAARLVLWLMEGRN